MLSNQLDLGFRLKLLREEKFEWIKTVYLPELQMSDDPILPPSFLQLHEQTLREKEELLDLKNEG